MSRWLDRFLTDESSVEEGGAVVASVAVVDSSHTEPSSTDKAVSDSSNKAVSDSSNKAVSDTSNEAVSDTNSVAEASNNSVTDSSHQAVSNTDDTDGPHPVGADTVGGARVVSNSSDRGPESL